MVKSEDGPATHRHMPSVVFSLSPPLFLPLFLFLFLFVDFLGGAVWDVL